MSSQVGFYDRHYLCVESNLLFKIAAHFSIRAWCHPSSQRSAPLCQCTVHSWCNWPSILV